MATRVVIWRALPVQDYMISCLSLVSYATALAA